MSRIKKSLADSLMELGLLKVDQLHHAQEEARKTGRRLSNILIDLHMITEHDLAQFLSDKFGILRIELNHYSINPKVIELIPDELAKKYEAIPLLKIRKKLTCAMSDPLNLQAIDELGIKTGCVIEPVVSTESEIKSALEQYYSSQGSFDDMLEFIGEETAHLSLENKNGEDELDQLKNIAGEPIVIRLINFIISKAITAGASDIHIEPQEKMVRLRFRIDGIMQEVIKLPEHLKLAMISRIKIMSNLDIAEKRVPQDGRFTIKASGKEVDVRISCAPTIYGEAIVMRILDVSGALLRLNQLGLPEKMVENFRSIIEKPYGIVLVTGPTGSGKSTMLYVSLGEINGIDKNIITIEDPVEYKQSGLRQIQVNPKVNLSFANGLRCILRQDPDVVMVGEIRDEETAEISIHAALTGHLVLSTLHTNDAPGSITRLVDMGIEPFLISSSLIGVLAQRLVRKICLYCKESYTPSEKVLEGLGVYGYSSDNVSKYYRGKGCDKCIGTGYKGRIGIYELMIPDEEMRRMIVERASTDEIRNHACSQGMMTLIQYGLLKAQEGVTTIEEIMRVTKET